MIDYNEEIIERWKPRETPSATFRKAMSRSGIIPKYECEVGTLAKIRKELLKGTPLSDELRAVEGYGVYHVIDHGSKYGKQFYILAPSEEAVQAWLDSSFVSQMLYTLNHCSKITHKVAIDVGGEPTVIFFGEGFRPTKIERPGQILHNDPKSEELSETALGDDIPFDEYDIL